MATMTKGEAAILLMRRGDGRQWSLTAANVREIAKACDALGLEGEDRRAVLSYLNMLTSDGTPRQPARKGP